MCAGRAPLPIGGKHRPNFGRPEEAVKRQTKTQEFWLRKVRKSRKERTGSLPLVVEVGFFSKNGRKGGQAKPRKARRGRIAWGGRRSLEGDNNQSIRGLHWKEKDIKDQ